MKLSIITINLNNETGLKKTIESVISQTLNNFEYVIIDGGSTDNSIGIIKNNSEKIDYWISEPDKGIYSAMNKGIARAKGEYCFFLNSGDYFVDEKVLEKVFKNDFQADILFGNLLVYFDGKFVGKSRGKDKLSFLDIYSSLIKHQSSFIRRELFDKYGLYNEKLKIVADWEFFLKSVGLGEATYKYLDIDMSCFDNNGISNNSESITTNERKAILETYLPVMMLPDYEFLLNYGKYDILTKYRVTRLLLRIMVKVLKSLNKIVSKE